MALKDLIVGSGTVTEEAIEKIISPYVKYEVDPPAVVVTPAGYALGNAEKVVVYLVAGLGWRYVVDDPPRISTRPADLEHALGIPGGTLRPVLKKLKDNHILTVADGQYSIRPSNIAAAGRIVSGKKSLAASPPKLRGVSSAKRGGEADDRAADKTKSKKKAGMPIKASLETLLREGFFSEYRTLAQVGERLQELAVNAKMNSLSGPVANLVREKKLERTRAEANGNQVWTYRNWRG